MSGGIDEEHVQVHQLTQDDMLLPRSFPSIPSPQSRLHHETGMRHKGNLERYIRDIYKKGQQKEKDKADEAKELSAIEAVSESSLTASPFVHGQRSPRP